MDNKEYVFNKVIDFMKQNKITCIDDIEQSDTAFTNSYQLLVDLFELVEDELNKKVKCYEFSIATVKDYNGNDITEVWLGDEEGNDFDDEEDVEIYNLIVNKLKMSYASEGCYHTNFYAHYVKDVLLVSGRFKHSEEMQQKME